MVTLKNIWNVVSTAVVVLAVVLAVALAGVRLFGVDVYSVLSGSMEPTYKTGSVIWVKNCEPEDVEVGDPITFVLDEDLTVATHRVVSIDEVEGEFTTKGDANDHVDSNPVLFENLIGKPVFSVPGLGYFVSWIQNPPGTYIAISIGAVILILMLLPDILSKDESGKTGKAKRRRKGEEDGDSLQAHPQHQPQMQVRPQMQGQPHPQAPARTVNPVNPAATRSVYRPVTYGLKGQGSMQRQRPETQERPRGRHAR